MNDRQCFIYGSLLDPTLLRAASPGATFDRIAHLPSFRLGFSLAGRPVVVADEGHTVWGGIFAVPEDELGAIARQRGETSFSAWAVDRSGARTEVELFSSEDGGRPDEAEVNHMLAGARHWDLPAGWVVGLEDLIDPFEF